jgi:SAM-dependent methyltransferase
LKQLFKVMQNESNLIYNGLLELQNTENYLKNYNNYIVELCVRQVEKPNSCIDFGAGIGTLSEILIIKFGISPICVEIDAENIKYLDDRNLQNFKDIDDVKGGIDLVFSSNVLEHIKDDVSVLQSIKDKLNSNGYLYLYLPANMLLWSELDVIVGHYRRYSRSEIKRKLRSVGFEIKSVNYSDSIGFFASLMMKLVGYDRDKGIGSPASLKIYDRYILPFSKFFDAIGLKLLFGKNIVVVAKKIDL